MNIYLLDEQTEVILNSLEYYLYTYNYFYPRKRMSLTKEDNMQVCLIRDTYEQILQQRTEINLSKSSNRSSLKIS